MTDTTEPAATGNNSRPPLRGLAMTRLETLTDAAFAFAVTLLAISIDEIPGTYTELVDALKGAPAFAASFAILLIYWRAHQTWSRRFGLEDLPSVLMTALLIFIVMIYVYPLKIMFGAMFHFLSGGWLSSTFRLESSEQFRGVLTIYGLGFFAMNLAIALLYGYARLLHRRLGMSARERFDTSTECIAWFIVGCFGLVSVIMAWGLDDDRLAWAAWLYMLLMVVGPVLDPIAGWVRRRRLGPAGI